MPQGQDDGKIWAILTHTFNSWTMLGSEQRVSSLEPMTDNTKVRGQEPKSPARWTKAGNSMACCLSKGPAEQVMHTPSQGDVELQAGITPVGL